MNQLETNPAPRRTKKKRNLFLPLFFLGLFLFLILGMAGIVYILFQFKSHGPIRVDEESALRIDLDASIQEYHPAVGLELLFQENQLFLHDYVDLIQKAANDDKIAGIYLVVGLQSLGWAQLQELHAGLTSFKSSGKWIWAYGEMWTEKEYYLATAADRVFLPPESVLLLDGLMSRTSFYAEALARLGIKVDVAAYGEYKNFADPYRYTEMSSAHREAIRALLDGMEAELFSAIETGRALSQSAIRSTFDAAVYNADQAIQAGLFDAIAYPDEIAREMSSTMGIQGDRDPPVVEAKHYFSPQRNHASWVQGDQIALLFASGAIQSGSAERGMFGDTVVSSDAFITQLEAARDNPHTKAIVVRIDSPGGSALASDVMWREIRKTSQNGIPVIASMGNVAASGGYYLAMGCDAIVAQPTSITGSIGVVSMRFDASSLYDMIKINVEVLKTSPEADFFDPHRTLSAEERERFDARTQHFYRTFVTKAAASRNQPYETFEKNARGRVWLGRDALDRGLIDTFGGLQEAIHLAASKAGIHTYSIHVYPKQKDFWTYLRESRLAQKPDAEMGLVARLCPPPLRLLMDCAFAAPTHTMDLALAPYWIEIQ